MNEKSLKWALLAPSLGLGAAAFIVLGWPSSSVAAPPADWSAIPTQTVKLFFPGQSGYQWLRSADHPGAPLVKTGGACLTCHKGKEEEMGAKTVGGGKLEPHPIDGKQATVDLAVQAAYDADNLYMRFQWKTRNDFPGSAHPHWRFDGNEWKAYGSPRLEKEVWEEGKPAIYEDRLALMIDDGGVPGFAEQGCWLTCHTGMRDMPDVASADDVKANPLLGGVLKRSDVRKYLPSTRTDDMASWSAGKAAEDIAALKAAGGFLDLMQWRAHRSNPVGMADDGYVLEYRLSDAGKDVFGSNWDKEKKQPKYMFDEAKVGFKAHTEDMLRDQSKATSLIVEDNTVAFDPDAGWKEGDMIPEYYTTRAGAAGSAADNTDVKGVWKDGMWTVVWVRPLNTGNADDKVLKANGVVTVGFAVHDDNITTRGHHVSFPTTLGLGAKADIEAVKVD
ncbi:MAG: ethylbenzene dehydrogenase-related protein [Bauldia sp.]|nr:ethylbenzene dehydrogenase-related protein [Bauldia sp.]